MNSPEPRRVLLHYRLVSKIDSGGMGEVYKAEDTRLGRTVAIKLLLDPVNQKPIARRRFLQEAQSASALNHPNIVTIFAIEEADGLDFIVMEYVGGAESQKPHPDRRCPATSPAAGNRDPDG